MKLIFILLIPFITGCSNWSYTGYTVKKLNTKIKIGEISSEMLYNVLSHSWEKDVLKHQNEEYQNDSFIFGVAISHEF